MEEILEPILRKRRIKQVLKEFNDETILCDIGCGFNALFLKEIKNWIKEGVGLDKKVSNYSDNKIRLIKFEFKDKIPLNKNYFTHVTMLAVIEHLSKPEKMLKEIKRILKNKGRIIITTPTPKAKTILELLSFIRFINPREIKEHKTYFGKKDFIKLFNKLGLKLIDYKTFQLGYNSIIIGEKH